jgi:hypothetical protein
MRHWQQLQVPVSDGHGIMRPGTEAKALARMMLCRL